MIAVIPKKKILFNLGFNIKLKIITKIPPTNHNIPPSLWVSFQIYSLSKVQGVLIPIK